MKSIFIVLCILSIVACHPDKTKDQTKGNQMLQDSTYETDKNITLVKENDKIQPGETMNRFEDYPNISQADLDAEKQVPGRGIQYIKAGDTLRVSEPRTKEK